MLRDVGGPSDGSRERLRGIPDSFYGRINEVASTNGAFSSLDAEKQVSDETAHRALEEELSRMSFRDACRKVSRLLLSLIHI